MKYIKRNMANAKIAGVAAGIGEYLNLDPVIIRAAFVLFTLAGGSGVLLYILAAILMPRD